MTEIFNDNVQINLTIDGQPWLLTEAEVERSRISTPDYADINGMIPDPDETLGNLPDDINQLIGAPFRLEADNQLISERDTDAEEDSLIFTGNLANISSTGQDQYEGIAYDPSQQGFATLEGEAEGAEAAGSLLNQSIYIPMPEWTYRGMFSFGAGTQYNPRTIKASELVARIAERLGADETNIDLEFGGKTFDGEEGEADGAFDTYITFEEPFPTIRKALKKAREQTKSEWWFDKEGVFNFGLPQPTKHELRFITETDAGKTTPPYQSIRIIGSGSASQEGYERNSMNMEDEIVLEREIAVDENQDVVPAEPEGETLKEPTFTYRNAEINTDAQAERTMDKLIEDLAEQQSDGKITVVGFPEVVPLDGVKMPNTEQQPMGGNGYGVYKVRHRLNGTDGFVTTIHVSGVIGVTRAVVSSESKRDEALVRGQRLGASQVR